MCVESESKMTSLVLTRSLAELAREALQIQYACNPLGLTKGFATATQELHDRLELEGLPSDTTAICNHPIYVMWAIKLADLATTGGVEVYGSAYLRCTEISQQGY